LVKYFFKNLVGKKLTDIKKRPIQLPLKIFKLAGGEEESKFKRFFHPLLKPLGVKPQKRETIYY
jgi:hypothetical protein